MDLQSPDFIPDNQFQPDAQPQQDAQAAPQSAGASGDFIPDNQFQPDDEKYGGTGQQVITGLEGAAQGLAGPLATWGEKKLGVDPQDIRGRAAANPWTHGISEAAGFGAGMYFGTGEAALLAKASEGVAGLAGLGEAASLGGKLAKGALTAGTEMGLFQAGDETSKYLLDDPNQTVGSALTNVGLSTLLGGVTGPAFSGLGMAAGKILDTPELKNFMDRLAFRKANADPADMIKYEADKVVNTFKDMNDEITGPTGMKSQAIEKLLPEAVTPKISNQAADIFAKAQDVLSEMKDKKVPDRLINDFNYDLQNFLSKATDANGSPKTFFDSMNEFKQNLQDYSKGKWGEEVLPRYHEAYNFVNATKSLSREVRLALEDSNVWGGAADLQKELNASWTKSLPAYKQFRGKFMNKIGNDYEISGDKFNSFLNQSGRATSATDRQKMMGNFIDAMDNHFKTVDKIYQSAGVENPFSDVGMSALKDSIEKKSVGARLADMWHERIGSSALGNLAGGALGELVLPGFGGAFLGKEVLGPAFGRLIQPLLEKYPNADLTAFRNVYSLFRQSEKGQKNLVNASKALFESGKTIPSQFMPTPEQKEALNKKAEYYGDNYANMAKIPGSVGNILPNHSTAIAQVTSNAVNYINANRPNPGKGLPFDKDTQVTPQQKADFDKILGIAQQPLSVLAKVKNGTLLPSDVQHLSKMYPDLMQEMTKGVMSQVADQMQKGQTIPYEMRQSLSLLFGQPLDSNLTPASIQAAQAVFAGQKMQQQGQMQQKQKRGNTSKMGKMADSHYTDTQAAASRRTES